MISIQDIQTLFQWPFLALQQDDSFNKLLSIFPFFSMLYMISSLKSQKSTSLKNEPSFGFLSNEPLYIQYLVWKASEDMSNHPGHVSDHALTPIASLSDLLPEDNKAFSRESDKAQSIVIPEEPMEVKVIEQISPTLIPEVDVTIQQEGFNDDLDAIEEIKAKAESINFNEANEADSITQTETKKVEDNLIEQLTEESVPTSRIIIAKIPEKSRVINLQRYQPIHREILSPELLDIKNNDEPIPLSPFSRWLRSTVKGVNEETSEAQFSTEYSGEAEIEQKSTRDKSKSPKKIEIERVISDSVRDHTYLVTEQYADLLHRQGYLERAINIYEKLMEKYPEKSTIFATKIQEINKEIV